MSVSWYKFNAIKLEQLKIPWVMALYLGKIDTCLSILIGHLAKLVNGNYGLPINAYCPVESFILAKLSKAIYWRVFWVCLFCYGCIFERRSHCVGRLALDSRYCWPHLLRARVIGTYLHTPVFLSVHTFRHQATSSTEERDEQADRSMFI